MNSEIHGVAHRGRGERDGRNGNARRQKHEGAMTEESTPLNAYTGLMVVTFLLSGVALIIGIGFLLAVVFLEPIVADRFYKRWHDKRREICARERREAKERDLGKD